MPVFCPHQNMLNQGHFPPVSPTSPTVEEGPYFCQENALHTAVGKGDVPGATKLLQRGHNVNCTNMQGETPLHRAIEQQNLPLVCLLLKHGADASLVPNYGVGSLYQAVETGNVDLVTILLATHDCSQELNLPDQTNPLMLAVIKENVEITQMLLKEGARVDITNDRGETPLFLAAMATDPDHQLILGILLLRFGADPSQKDPHGHTPQHYSWHNIFTAYMKEYSCVGPIPTPGSPPRSRSGSMADCIDGQNAEKTEEKPPKLPSLLSLSRRAILFQMVLSCTNQKQSIEDHVRMLPVPVPLKEYLVFNTN